MTTELASPDCRVAASPQREPLSRGVCPRWWIGGLYEARDFQGEFLHCDYGARHLYQDPTMTSVSERTRTLLSTPAPHLLRPAARLQPILAKKGEPNIDLAALQQVAAGEIYLKQQGFQPVRVRYYGPMARLEVDTHQIDRLVALRSEVAQYFRQIGFQYVAVDLDGYRSGSLNEVLGK